MSSTHDQDRAKLLRQNAHAFCQALLSLPRPRELLKKHFSSSPTIHEHGPSWASTKLPFLGYAFTGVTQCEEYFSLLSATLTMELDEHSFPAPEDFVVDLEAGAVTVVGKGRFGSRETGRSWEERFVYILRDWDEGRLGTWDIWADPLSAWVAVGQEDVDGWAKGEHRGL